MEKQITNKLKLILSISSVSMPDVLISIILNYANPYKATLPFEYINALFFHHHHCKERRNKHESTSQITLETIFNNYKEMKEYKERVEKEVNDKYNKLTTSACGDKSATSQYGDKSATNIYGDKLTTSACGDKLTTNICGDKSVTSPYGKGSILHRKINSLLDTPLLSEQCKYRLEIYKIDSLDDYNNMNFYMDGCCSNIIDRTNIEIGRKKFTYRDLFDRVWNNRKIAIIKEYFINPSGRKNNTRCYNRDLVNGSKFDYYMVDLNFRYFYNEKFKCPVVQVFISPNDHNISETMKIFREHNHHY